MTNNLLDLRICRLPKDAYDELTYIESDGNQYIDTNYVPNNNTKVEYDFYLKQHAVSTFQFGVWGNTTTDGRMCWYDQSDTTSQYGFGGGAGVENTNYKNFTITDLIGRHYVVMDKTSCKVDGVTVVSGLSGNNSTNTRKFWIGKCNDLSGRATNPTNIYAVKIWEDDTLVRDYIPAKRKSDGVIGLYDLVNAVFYTSATSTNFTGGDVVVTVPEISIGNKDVDHIDFPREFSGYETLQYLETPSASTTALDNAFIDTGYAPSGDGYKYEIKFYRNAPTSTNFIGVFGCQNNNAIICLYSNNGYYNGFASKSGSARITNLGIQNEREYIVTAEGKNDTVTYNVNGTTYTGTTYTTMTDLTGKNIYLFKNNNTSVQPMAGKIYYFKLWKGDVLIRDMIPVRRISDNALGFLDRVENKFYGNAGNGTIQFVAGPKTTVYETVWTRYREPTE